AREQGELEVLRQLADVVILALELGEHAVWDRLRDCGLLLHCCLRWCSVAARWQLPRAPTWGSPSSVRQPQLTCSASEPSWEAQSGVGGVQHCALADRAPRGQGRARAVPRAH